MKKLFFNCFLLLISLTVFAEVKLPKIFGDNMVLQRNKPIPVWGWADANESVTVTFNGASKTAKADDKGYWRVNLDKQNAGGPFTLTIKGNNTITFNNVLVGEVWVCSGQSNMEMPIEGWGKVNNYEQEIANANYPMIHHIKVPNAVSGTPQNDITSGEWKVCSPQTAGDFTATGYFFARELFNNLKVPIGLINTSWGGTMVETWISREAFANSADFKAMIAGMPLLNLDSLSKLREEKMKMKLDSIQRGLPTGNDIAEWKDANFDDSNWPHMQLPNLWETMPALSDLDGDVWFRKTINVDAANAGKPATLELAMIDDNDVTYINGQQVGSTNSYNASRKYTIPAGVLKAGANVIAVRVDDTGGGGGIYGDSANMKLTIDNNATSLAGNWTFKVEKVSAGNTSVGPNSYPTLLFNAMINPLIPYAIEGAIWYQGEANAGRAYEYSKSFPLMIKDWRSRWQQGDFPFYFVQLASWNAGNGNSNSGSNWAELRQSQTNTLALPNTGMSITTDIGNEKDIHPKNKQDVGKRLAAIALHNTYNKQVTYSGPVYQSMKTEGNKIILTFKPMGNGLMAKGGELKGFEIAGDDKHFYNATATIQDNTVVVTSTDVAKPTSVHYAWRDFAGDANLYNTEGFPAGAFKTDNWKGITENNKYLIGQ